jgi:hypothetical protein
MVWVRGSARRFAACWLAGQLAMAAVAAIALSTVPAGRLAFALERCQCDDGTAAGICPMHHRSGPAPLSTGQCGMRSCPSPDAALHTVASSIGIIPESVPAVLEPVESPLSVDRVTVFDRALTPESPPPRA